ncbi:MAG: hypothetical protein O8C66_08430 [Candidatus Methanoperedens sp.]|nr:hypothetical protein [Candidatus Methanoperedens sp.]MCZ7370523.1 hypothetical protein [Candidatus Methanoperedens sp.]
MKVVRIEDTDKIHFDNLKADFKNRFSKEPDCDVKEVSTLKDSCFLNILLEVWRMTPYEEAVRKLSESQVFNNYKK